MWCKLHDIIQITNGRSQKYVENVNGKYPIYGSGGIIGKAVDYLCEAGSTIIGRKGTINNPLFVKERFWNIDTAFGMKPMYAISDLYFFYFCQYFDFSKLDKSTAVPSLTQSAIGEVFIPIPPTKEQKRITDEISYWLGFIDTLESNLINLQLAIKQTKSKILDLAIHGKLVPQYPTDEPASELLKRINPKAEITCDNGHYQKLPFKIPKSWVWCGHNNVLEISGGSQPAKNLFISVPKANYIRLYQIRDYGENPIPVYIPEELASKRTEKGDILLARYGGSLGKVFHAERGAYNVAMAKVIFKYPNVIFKDFAYYYYLSDLYQGRLKEISRTAQAGFNSSDFNEMLFPLPPYEEQKRIVNVINKTFTILDKIAVNL